MILYGELRPVCDHTDAGVVLFEPVWIGRIYKGQDGNWKRGRDVHQN